MPPQTTTPKLTLILDDVRSVYNVGSAFRTADAVGVGEIVLAGFTPGPDTHPERINKTALGAQSFVSWRRVKRAVDAVRALRKRGVSVIALETGDASGDYRAHAPVWPMAVVVGNEVKGVRASMSHNVDRMVKIPMRGNKESLNVSVALGVALYEFTRRWK
ncbi:MAG: TrmH family RNA methyltransferase [Candidatus Pacebacteria bacterium]|nr:TrmH family RNA methyltransferase [Candidatus Paceibacterota bacterium]